MKPPGDSGKIDPRHAPSSLLLAEQRDVSQIPLAELLRILANIADQAGKPGMGLSAPSCFALAALLYHAARRAEGATP